QKGMASPLADEMQPPILFCPSCGERKLESLAGGDYVCTKCKVQFYVVKSPVLSVGRLKLRREARGVRVGDQDVPMTVLEFKLLEFLMLHPGIVYDRDKIIDAVWENNI